MAQVKLEHRALGTGGLSVSAIGLGCMSLSGIYGAADDAQSEDLIRHAIDEGVDHLDSSDMYGWGHNEQVHRPRPEGPARSCRAGDEVRPDPEPRRPERRERPPRVRDAGLRGQPAAARRRRDRPLLPAPRRSVRADRGHGRRDGAAGASRARCAISACRKRAGDDPPRARGASDRRGADGIFAAVSRRGGGDARNDTRRSASASSPTRRSAAASSPARSRPSPISTGGVPRIRASRSRTSTQTANWSRASRRWPKEKGCTPAQLTLAWLLAQGPDVVAIPGTRYPAAAGRECRCAAREADAGRGGAHIGGDPARRRGRDALSGRRDEGRIRLDAPRAGRSARDAGRGA